MYTPLIKIMNQKGCGTCGMTITERCIQTHVGQLAPPHVLLLGRHVGEDDLPVLETHLLSRYVDIRFSNLDTRSLNFNVY